MKSVVKLEPATPQPSKPVILTVPKTVGFHRPKVEYVVETVKKEKLENSCVAATGGVAASVGVHRCEGSLVNVNELKTLLKPITVKSGQGKSGPVTPERVIILSRLGLPFWDGSEVSICQFRLTLIVGGKAFN